jgi:glycosyltransferase involved in cell wall biosynthesis
VRILHALHFFLPKHSGGTEIYTLRVARAQARAGHDVTLFFSEKIHSRADYELLRRTTEGLDCRVVVNNLLEPDFRATFANPRIEERFDEVVRECRPQVVHFQHLMLLSMGLVGRAKAAGASTVLTLQDFWLWCARMGQLLQPDGSICPGPTPERCSQCLATFPFTQKQGAEHAFRTLGMLRRAFGVDLSPLVERVRGWQPLLARRGNGAGAEKGRPIPQSQLRARAEATGRVVEAVDHVIAPSRMLLDRALDWGVPAGKISLLRYGVDLAPRAAARRYAPHGKVRFAFLGTPAPHKGVHVLIDAFRAAELERARPHGAELVIFGGSRTNPAYFADLKRRARGLPVRFAGAIDNAQVPDALEQVDALVVPSLWLENWPVSVQEARLARVPVVASRLGGLAEAVRDGVDGLLFEPGDVYALAAALRGLVDEPRRLGELAAAAEMPPPMHEHVAALDAIYARAGAAAGGPP